MRSLRRRLKIDRFDGEQRPRRGRWGRWIYLAVTLAFFAWLVQLFFGSMLFFRCQGTVLAKVATVGIEFSATIRDLPVQEDDRVSAGDIVARVTSQDVAERIAQLSSHLADLQSKRSSLQIRGEVAGRLKDVTAKRATVTADAKDVLDRLHGQRLLTTRDRLSIYESEYRSKLDTEALDAERKAITTESRMLADRLDEASASLAQLKALYADGEMRAPVTGVVGHLYVAKGSVVRLGDPLMDVYGGDRFVHAYVPAGAIYEVRPGDRVSVRYDLSEWDDVVEHIEPVAALLPREFQSNFKPVDRMRVLHISIKDTGDLPPLFSKVEVQAGDWPPSWLLHLLRWSSRGSGISTGSSAH